MNLHGLLHIHFLERNFLILSPLLRQVLCLPLLFIGHPQGMPLPSPDFGYDLPRIRQQYHVICKHDRRIRQCGAVFDRESLLFWAFGYSWVWLGFGTWLGYYDVDWSAEALVALMRVEL